jgi:hypothetical protein
MHGAVVLLAVLACAAYAGGAPEGVGDLLVAMHDSGTVERFDGQTGEWVGTFAWDLDAPNALAHGPDGALYVACGGVGGPGSIVRLDAQTGEVLGELAPASEKAPANLSRATDLLFAKGALFVASRDDGRVVKLDAATGAWVADVARGTPGGVTQVAVRDGKVYYTDFQRNGVGAADLATGDDLGLVTRREGFAPWGIALDPAGRIFWSGSDNTIQRFDPGVEGGNETWAGPTAETTTPIRLALLTDGRLVCSGFVANAVTVWDSGTARRQLLAIRGERVKGPMGTTTTTTARRAATGGGPALELGNWFRKRDREAHRIGGAPVVRVEAAEGRAALEALGWDTEGGNRARLNLLRGPATLKALVDGRWRTCTALSGEASRPSADEVAYPVRLDERATLRWRVRAERNGGLTFGVSATGDTGAVKGLRLCLPFNPRIACTCLLSESWTDDGVAALPAVLSAPDIGQMHVTCPQRPDLRVRVTGSRLSGKVQMDFELPVPDAEGYEVRLRPLRLATPGGFHDQGQWRQARRGWFNLLQFSAARPQEGGHAQTPAGLWSNNVISDPVSSTVYWLADHALLVPRLAAGVSVLPMLRRTVEFWMDQKANEEGIISYVVSYTQQMMDANPAVLIGSWAYATGAGDMAWLRARIERLEFIAAYLERRDVDGDGLVESQQSGNRGTHAFGDTAWDTYSSGHKNAYVNALAYRALRGMAELEGRLGRAAQCDRYTAQADAIRARFRETFYNPETGWLGWWRSEDGRLHDVWADVPTSLAVMYGLVSPEDGRPMLDALWAALRKSGFSRFDLGVPLNIRPVHRDDQYEGWGGQKEDGSDTFGKYLNGGCCVSNTYYFLAANQIVGRTERAGKVLAAMLDRQEKGVFPNGGGFQNGFVDRYPDGAEFMDWEGNTCGYEGHLIYSWAFLQSALLAEPEVRERLFGGL